MSIAGTDVARSLLVACACVGLVLFIVVVRRQPKVGFVCWSLAVCFVPIWIGVEIKAFIPGVTVCAVALIISLVSLRSPRLIPMDWFVLLLILIVLAATVFGYTTRSTVFTLIATWGGGYLLGRLVMTQLSQKWMFGCIAVAFTGVALLAIAEFVMSKNLFTLLRVNNSLYSTWGTLQSRGGLLRVEGAFGHSIALGASLALAIPLAFASGFRIWIRASMIVCMLVAAALTFSRTGMICSVLALLLSIVFSRGRMSGRRRLFLAAGLAAATAVVLPLISSIFDNAGAEATASASYRGDLLSLISDMRPIGLSPTFAVNSQGDSTFGSFRSIDSALILMGLTYGLIPLLLTIGLLSTAVVLVLRGRATAATIAIAAQIPAFATVALLTQYAVFVWFVAGLAAAGQSEASRSDHPPLTVTHTDGKNPRQIPTFIT